MVDTVRGLLGKPPRKPLHYRDLKHHHRVPYSNAIAASRVRTVAVLVHKPSLQSPESFRERYRLYFYGVRYLLERVSWLCRDRRLKNDANDGSADVEFSNRSGMKHSELREYLDRLKGKSEVTIDWTEIKSEQVAAYSAGKRMGLQVADAIASGYYYALEPRYGHVETRYAALHAPRIYRHKGKCFGYGVKFWPPEGQALALGRGDWDWTRQEG